MAVSSNRNEALGRFQRQIQAELERARRREDLSRVAQLRAMQSVLKTWALPRVCPFTVTMAGRAAIASLQGESEEQCCAEAYRRYGHFPEGRLEVSTAIRLLKAAGLWPWSAAG